MRKFAKVDSNHVQIVKDLRKMGVSVLSTADLGSGAPDLLCGFRGACYIFEVKPPGKIRLTDDEKDFMLAWNGQYAVIQSAEQAMEIMTLIPN